MSSSGKGQDEKIKLTDVLKFCLFIFGAGGIVFAFFGKNNDLSGRIFCFVFGAVLCAIATISTVRLFAISLLAFGVGCTGIPNIISESGELELTWVATVVASFVVSILFGYKAFHRFHFKRISHIGLSRIDAMTGLEFEHYTAQLLKKLGYKNVSVTKASGDQGIDVLAEKNGVRYAIQCKNYSNKLDNTPVQEAFAGKEFYGCDVGVVITNSTFTEGACELANAIGVQLWDRQDLKEMIHTTNSKKSIFLSKLKPQKPAETYEPENTLSTIPELIHEVEGPAQDRQAQDPHPIASATQIAYTHLPAVEPIYTSTPSVQEPQQMAPRPIANSEPIAYTTTEALLQNLQSVGDEMLPAAVDVILETGQASVSVIQRRLKLGYARAARIVDEMEKKGIVGPFRGSKPRLVLITEAQWQLARPVIPTK